MKLNNEEGGVQMSKKLVFVCLAMLAIASYALADQPPVTVGDWEGLTNEGWMDHPLNESRGWAAAYVDDPEIMPSKYEFSDAWSSSGDISLKYNCTGWTWAPKIDVHTELYNHSVLEFDIFAVAQDGSAATYAQIQQMVYSGATAGWTSLTGSEFSIGLGGSATHCVLDYMQLGDPAKTSPTDAYGSFVFAYNADAPVFLYLDNVQLTGPELIPEPATIGLLGLGGLALLRRKK